MGKGYRELIWSLGIWGYGQIDGGSQKARSNGDYNVQAGRYRGVFERGKLDNGDEIVVSFV